MIKFLVKGQSIETLEHEIIAADQISFVRIHFAFDNSWKPLHKVVQFFQDEDSFFRVLGTDSTSCLLPAELHPGSVKMSLFGYDTAAAETVRATTVIKTLNVRPSGFDGEGANTVPPTPDLYQQLISVIEDMLKNHDCGSGSNGLSAYELAVQNGFTGTLSQWLESLKGKDGRDGTDGKDGRDGKDGTNGSDSPPCNCDSRIQQLQDRLEYEIHDFREEIEPAIHSHANIHLLEKINSENLHTHSNKSVLDAITKTRTDSWDAAVTALEGVEEFLATLVEVI